MIINFAAKKRTGQAWLFWTRWTMHTALPIMDTDLTRTNDNCRTSFEFRFWFLGKNPPETWDPGAKARGTAAGAVAKSRKPFLKNNIQKQTILLDISDPKPAGALGETARKKVASSSKASGML